MKKEVLKELTAKPGNNLCKVTTYFDNKQI